MRDTLDQEFSFSFESTLGSTQVSKPNSQVQILSVNPIILYQNKVNKLKKILSTSKGPNSLGARLKFQCEIIYLNYSCIY